MNYLFNVNIFLKYNKDISIQLSQWSLVFKRVCKLQELTTIAK